MPSTSTSDETQVRERLNAWTRALQAKDIDAMMALYAPEVVAFDLAPPSQVPGADPYRKNLEMWMSSMRGPVGYEIHDLKITAGSDVAFSHCLSHVNITRTNGEKEDYWVRLTVGFQKRNGEWKVTHDHVSMPFDMKTTQAIRELVR